MRKERSMLLAAWLVLLIVDLGGVLRDAVDPWSPLPAREEQASVQVYFSPSCRACQTLLSRADDLNDAVWYPVPEDARDILIIADMADNLKKGMPLARAAAEARRHAPDPVQFESDAGQRLALLRPDMLLLQFRLWRNHAHVLAAGSDRLPFVEFKGLPAFLAEQPAPAPESRDTTMNAAVPDIPGLDVAGFCDGESETPCEEGSVAPSSSDLIDTSGMVP